MKSCFPYDVNIGDKVKLAINGEEQEYIITAMLVTHDVKVAAKCTRVLFIVDGNIKGEYNINRDETLRDRERDLNNWLLEMGW